MATHPGPGPASGSGRRSSPARWLILRPIGGDRPHGPVSAGSGRTTLPGAGRVASAAFLGAWTGGGVTVAFLMPLALGAHVPTAFAAELMGALLPRALLGGLVFATLAFLLTLRTGGPSRTLAAVSALSAALARNILVPRAAAALASGSPEGFAWLHLMSILVFAVSVLSAAAGAATLIRPHMPRDRDRGPGQATPHRG